MFNKQTAFIITIAFLLGGCAGGMTETQQGSAQGALIGAGTGALIGVLAGDGKGAAIGAGAGVVAGAIAGYAWSQRLEEQKKQMQAATAGTAVQVSKTADNRLKLDIPSDISFDTNDTQVKPNMQRILASFATSLKNNQQAMVAIVGHTDNSGNDAINNPLSISRAASTRSYLVNQGISIGRINIDGRGSYEPIVPNNSDANRAKNRRVEIFVHEQH